MINTESKMKIPGTNAFIFLIAFREVAVCSALAT